MIAYSKKAAADKASGIKAAWNQHLPCQDRLLENEKAAILCFSLVKNHPFIDGNKRVSHAAMEIFLVQNGMDIFATVDEQEKLMIDLASGRTSHEELVSWLQEKIGHRTA